MTILIFISTLFIEPSQADLLSHENLSLVIEEHLKTKNIRTDNVKVDYPGHWIAKMFNVYNKLVDDRVMRSAQFTSNDQKYTCIFEAEPLSENEGKGVRVGIVDCSPSKLPNGVAFPGTFLFPFNLVMSRTNHDPEELKNENQTKPDDEVKPAIPIIEKKSVLRAN